MDRLNVGCGNHYAPGWINLDPHWNWADDVRPDVQGSVLALPFAAASMAAVYCGHVLEHLELAQVPRALAEIRRVLRPGGSLLIVGPDRDRAGDDPTLIRMVEEGAQRWPGDEHRWVSTQDLMLQVLTADGWRVHILHQAPPPWPVVAQVPWQFALQAWS